MSGAVLDCSALWGEAVREVLVPESPVLPWGSTHHQLRPGGERLDVGAVVVLVHLAQDGGHAGHVVALGERSWSGPAGSCSRHHGTGHCPCSSSQFIPWSPNCPGVCSPPAHPAPFFPSSPDLLAPSCPVPRLCIPFQG